MNKTIMTIILTGIWIGIAHIADAQIKDHKASPVYIQWLLNKQKHPEKKGKTFKRGGATHEVKLLPLVANGDYSHFWNQPEMDKKDGAFRTNRFLNRQLAVQISTMLLPELYSVSGTYVQLHATARYEHHSYELNDRYDYFINEHQATSNALMGDNMLQIATSKGISLEMSSILTGLELRTHRNTLWEFSFGGGINYQYYQLKTRKDTDYTPWAINLTFDKVFKNEFKVNPYGKLGLSFGGRLRLNADYLFYPMASRPKQATPLYYSRGVSTTPQQLPLEADNKWMHTISVGLSFRW